MDAPSLSACNCFALRAASRHVTQLYDALLAPLNLRTTQFAILVRLQQGGPCSINALAERLVMDRTTLGRNIRPLQREALLSVGPDAGDRRTRVLAVTPKGAALIGEAAARWNQAQAMFEGGYGEARASALRQALAEVAATRF